MGARRKAREIAFQALYSWEMNDLDKASILSFDWMNEDEHSKLSEDIKAFAKLLIAGVIDNIEEVDKGISKHLKNWDINRINRVDLAILRLSAYSLIYQKEIPHKVVIDEAINISKKYSAGEAFKFVNGVLDNLHKEIVG
ncbi:transcription antitermination factor NusB [Spirochaeta cellobiosiphila]|uniref:transcription antitermination factor NusB n=1 Tax=Spirochaeta cellobiosiphila TaxID=504483 RepID=UPI00041F391A|nr:transcription antitermination factor NusB [Spirochaeta cellobiosiphila]